MPVHLRLDGTVQPDDFFASLLPLQSAEPRPSCLVQVAPSGTLLPGMQRPAPAPLVPSLSQLTRPLYQQQQLQQWAPSEDDLRLLPKRSIARVALKLGGPLVSQLHSVKVCCSGQDLVLSNLVGVCA